MESKNKGKNNKECKKELPLPALADLHLSFYSVFVILIIVLFFASLAYAQTTTLPLTSNWIIVAMISVGVAYLVVAITYMAAKSVNNSEFISWANKELFQVTATLFIVFIIFGTSMIEDYVVNSYVDQNLEVLRSYGYGSNYQGQPAAIAAAEAYLDMVNRYVEDRIFASTLLYINLQSALTSIQYIKQSFFGGLVTISLEEVRNTLNKPLSDMYGPILSSLFAAWGITVMQTWFLEVVRNFAFTLILPLGIVLRTTPYMRNTGSALIAIAIGFYLVFPLTYLLNYKIVEAIKCSQPGPINCKDWANDPILSDNVFEKIIETAGIGGGITGQLFKLNSFNVGALGLFALNMAVAIPIMAYLEKAAAFALVVLAIALPIIDVVIAFGITRELAQLLGTDLSLDSFLQII